MDSAATGRDAVDVDGHDLPIRIQLGELLLRLPVGGIIAERWGPERVYLMAGVIVGSLLLFARPLFRRIDEAMAEFD